MWQRLSVLVLCGMSALWADACDGLPADAPRRSVVLWRTLSQLSFRLSVKPGLPAFRITVRAHWQIRGADIDEAHAGN